MFGEEVDIAPPVDACDLVSYLVLQTIFVTAKQFKALKGLEAYNQFVCGWVKEIKTLKVAGKYLTTSRVSCLDSIRPMANFVACCVQKECCLLVVCTKLCSVYKGMYKNIHVVVD